MGIIQQSPSLLEIKMVKGFLLGSKISRREAVENLIQSTVLGTILMELLTPDLSRPQSSLSSDHF